MSRFRIVRFAATSWLALFLLVASAQAQDPAYDMAATWLSTYPTSTSLNASHSATWGQAYPTSTGGIWAAGSLSSNWSNNPATVSPSFSSAIQGSQNYNTLATYYRSNSVGFQTSGTAGTAGPISNVASFTYTVPFQAYQLNPGATINMNMGVTTTEQLSTTNIANAGEKITLPTSWTSAGATTGVVTGIGAIENIKSTSAYGFTTTAFNIQKSFSDGQSGNTVPDVVPGVFYNYGANGSSSFDPLFSVASSGSTDTLTLNGSLGPAYVSWTAPANGTATVNATFWDTSWSSSDNDGAPSYFIFNSKLKRIQNVNENF